MSKLKGFSKILSSTLVTKKYPSIDKIDVEIEKTDNYTDLDDSNRLLLFKIYLNTEDWNIKLNPQDFVDFYLTPLGEYLGFSQNFLHFYEVYNVDGTLIIDVRGHK